jgi:hypothetical protein
MSKTSPTREAFHDPRDSLQAVRMSPESNNKQLKQTSKSSVTSKVAKGPKIIKTLSSSEKIKLASLYKPKISGEHGDIPEKLTPSTSLDLYLTILNHQSIYEFIPKPCFEGYRQQAKKNIKVVQDSMTVFQTFWMTIYIKFQIIQTHL